MNQKSTILGGHAYLFREGDAFTVPSSGTCGRAAKPGATDTGWNDLGIFTTSGITPTVEKREIYAPAPGQLQVYDVIDTKRKLGFKMDLEQLSPIAWENILKTAALGSGSNVQYNPLAGVTKRGWLKVLQYDETDTLFNTMDWFVHLAVDGEVKFADDVVKVTLDCTQLWSTLNTGTIA